MGMAEPTAFHTAEMVRELIDEGRPSPRYETVYGELLVTPAPGSWHQEITGRMFVALRVYLEREPGAAGHVYVSPADISWGRRDVLVQPDVFVVPRPTPIRNQSWSTITRLLLAIEVLSPSTGRADRFTKRRLYQAQGTPLYWLIDPERETVDEWTADADLPRSLPDRLVWHPPGAIAPFVLTIAELLRDG